jgi:hypothetical protein
MYCSFYPSRRRARKSAFIRNRRRAYAQVKSIEEALSISGVAFACDPFVEAAKYALKKASATEEL